jgi:hypothetical protein
MNEPTLQTAASNPKRRRFRFGMRGLIGAVLLLGLFFGWLARMQRQAVEREAVVAELARDRVIVNRREPTLLCLVLSKLLRERTILPDTPARFSRWVNPGWFSRPVGFNAGRRLRDEEVPRVVERLQRLGDVHEVQFRGSSLNGLRLFYIDKVPYYQLGPERDTCTFKTYTTSGVTSGSSPSGHR